MGRVQRIIRMRGSRGGGIRWRGGGGSGGGLLWELRFGTEKPAISGGRAGEFGVHLGFIVSVWGERLTYDSLDWFFGEPILSVGTFWWFYLLVQSIKDGTYLLLYYPTDIYTSLVHHTAIVTPSRTPPTTSPWPSPPSSPSPPPPSSSAPSPSPSWA